MYDERVTLKLNSRKYDALAVGLFKAGKNLETELSEVLESLYKQYVSEEERERINDNSVPDSIEEQWRSTRMGALRICARGNPHYFTMDGRNNFYTLASDFKRVKGKLDYIPLETLKQYFVFGKPSEASTFEIYSEAIQNSSRIYGVYDFDADRQIVRKREYGADEWSVYDMKDVMEVLDRVAQIERLSPRKREEFFREELACLALAPPAEETVEISLEQ